MCPTRVHGTCAHTALWFGRVHGFVCACACAYVCMCARVRVRSCRYRAATHNKGIMNGISAVVLATGNDTRAIEAGAHAYASRKGWYTSLTDYEVTAEGDLAVSLAERATQPRTLSTRRGRGHGRTLRAGHGGFCPGHHPVHARRPSRGAARPGCLAGRFFLAHALARHPQSLRMAHGAHMRRSSCPSTARVPPVCRPCADRVLTACTAGVRPVC